MMEEYVFALWKKNTNLVNHVFETNTIPDLFLLDLYLKSKI